LALVLAVFRRPVAWASAVLLALFAGAMTLSFGIKAPDAELRSRFIEFFFDLLEFHNQAAWS